MAKKRAKPGVRVVDAVKEYQRLRPLYEEFTRKLHLLIEEILKSHGIDYDVIGDRTKLVSRFEEKIRRPGKAYNDPVREFTDLAGIRIVLFYLEDVEKVARIIKQEFSIDQENSVDQSDLLRPHEFGYRSIHYVVSLSSDRKNLVEWAAFGELKAEIQIRTVLQHAWASISRALDYTQEHDVPSSLRRKLFRLSGLLEIADEEFSSFADGITKLSKVASKKIIAGDVDLEVNATTIEEYLKHSELVRHMDTHAKKIGFGEMELDTYRSELPIYCHDLGINSIKELDEELIGARKWTDKYLEELIQDFKKHHPETKWSVNPSFLFILILIHSKRDKVNLDYLIKRGWSESIASFVLSVAKKNF